MSVTRDIESPRGTDAAEGIRHLMSQDAPTTDHTLETSAGAAGADPLAVPSVGDRVGPYRITSLAGAGGMGVVFQARDEQLDRAVALKLIAPEYARDPRFREMFLRESRAAASIEHPNVIPIYGADQDGDRLYIAMRFVEGESLAERIAQRGKLPPAQAAGILGQVATALEAAHRRGLLHRDVKPANIMVSDDDQGPVYLSDFGLATRFVEDAAGGRWAGTLAYLAPEQIRGGALDARTDVYALGCVLFQTLTGRVPFPTRDERAAQVAHLTQAPPSASEITPGVPAGFDAVIARAMAKRPEDRFPSAAAFATALAALRFDAVLVHHPDDRPAADALRAALLEERLEVWAPSGDSGDVADALRASGACIVLVGPAGLGDWSRDHLALAQEIALRDRAFRLSAALLPGAPDPFGPGMGFLAGRAWADLRMGVSDRDGRRELLRLVREEPPPAPRDAGPEVNPYRGLTAFGEDDAGFFVGREDEVARLAERLRGRRLLAVVGPSGSGKSSLVAAGLVPALRRDTAVDWRITTLTPGARPLAALAAAVARVVPPSSGRPGAGALGTDPAALRRALDGALPDGDAHRVLLVIDQFEEAFTLAEVEERSAFFDAIADATTLPGGRVWVVTAMRADFYSRCADHPALRDLVAANQFLVGPMSPAALRRVIEVPARRAGLTLEAGLTKRILGDLAGRPGALPLLQHLLFELWHRRRGRELTLEAYAASGGVEGAVSRRAEEVFTALTPGQHDVARQVLLRLTQPGEGTEDTRRRAEMRELALSPDQHRDVDAVVGAFTAARLFTTGRDGSSGRPTVEVAHEALIRTWPRLRGWLDEARDRLRAQHRLTQAVEEWERSNRDEAHLYRGVLLSEWRERGPDTLNDRERAFLAASAYAADRELRARRRRTRTVIAGLASGLVLVGGAGAFALVQRNDAQDQQRVAEVRQLAAEARAQLAVDPERSLLLALEAYRREPLPEAEGALRQAVFDSHVRTRTELPGASIAQVVPVGGDRIAVLSADREAFVWSSAASGPATPVAGAQDVTAIAALPGGGLLAGDGDGGVTRWRDVTGAPVRRSPTGAPVVAIAADARGQTAAVAREGGRVELLDVATGRTTRVLGSLPGGVYHLAMTPDGARVAAGAEGEVRVWDAATGRAVPTGLDTPDSYFEVAISPDGRRVATAGIVGTWLIDLGSKRGIPLVGHDGSTSAVAFGGDGRFVATGGSFGDVRIWDGRDGTQQQVLRGHLSGARSVTFRDDGTVVSGGEDGTVRTWAWRAGLPTVVATGAEEFPVNPGGLAVSSDGRVAVTATATGVKRWRLGATPASRMLLPLREQPWAASLDADSSSGIVIVAGRPSPVNAPGIATALARLDRRTDVGWAAVAGDLLVTRTAPASGVPELRAGPRSGGGTRTLIADAALVSSAVSADGRVVAAGLADGRLAWFDTVSGERHDLPGHAGAVVGLAVAADGSRIASGGEDQTVRLWDTRTGGSEVLRGHRGLVGEVRFTAGDARVLSAGGDGVRLWDATDASLLLAFPRTEVNAAGISADGTRIVAASAQGPQWVLSWDCEVCGDARDAERLAQARVTRALTPAERNELSIGE